jgi:hypothetical protein
VTSNKNPSKKRPQILPTEILRKSSENKKRKNRRNTNKP